jgi:uncharacterized membrane protein
MSYRPLGQTPESTAPLTDRAYPYSSGWEGWVTFAGVVLGLVGFFNVIDGFTALASEEVFASENDLLVFDFTTWGWLMLGMGVVQIAAGIGLLRGQTWARVVGVIFVGINAVQQLAFLSHYPFWSALIIAIDVFVIYALTVHGRELAK